MISAFVVIYFAISVIVSTALIAACALSGRSQRAEVPLSSLEDLTSVMMPAIAEVHLPMRHLQPAISPSQA